MADESSPERLDALIATDDEYLVFCGVVGLGRLLAERQAGTVVQRAAAAGLCEPRLLQSPEAASAAVDVCDRATRALAALPLETRRDEDVRVLRKGLGYCWSVAVAADPAHGLPRFQALASCADPDVAWIVRENSRKARLARLL